jgi:hypothetical protein
MFEDDDDDDETTYGQGAAYEQQPEYSALPEGFIPYAGEEDATIPENAQYTAGGLPPGLPEGFVPYQPAGGGTKLPEGFVPYTPKPEAEGVVAHAVRTVAHNILPGAAAIGGGVLGGGLGGIPGAIGGGVAAFYGAHELQERGLKMLGFDDSQQQAVNAAANPKTQIAAEVASALPFFGVGAAPRLVGTAIRTATEGVPLATGLRQAPGAVREALTGTEAGRAALGTAGVGAGVGVGLEGVNQVMQGEFDPTRLGVAAGAGAILTRPRAATEAIERSVGQMAGRVTGQPEKWSPELVAERERGEWLAEQQGNYRRGMTQEDWMAGQQRAYDTGELPARGADVQHGTPGSPAAAGTSHSPAKPVEDPGIGNPQSRPELAPREAGKESPQRVAVEEIASPEINDTVKAALDAAKEPIPAGQRGAVPEAAVPAEPRPVASVEPRPAAPVEAAPPVEPAPVAGALDRTLANRMLNQPAVLRQEAAKRGTTPEALRAQAEAAVREQPALVEPKPVAPVQEVAPKAEPPAKFSIAKDGVTGQHVLFRNDEEIGTFASRGAAEKARTVASRREARRDQISEAVARREQASAPEAVPPKASAAVAAGKAAYKAKELQKSRDYYKEKGFEIEIEDGYKYKILRDGKDTGEYGLTEKNAYDKMNSFLMRDAFKELSPKAAAAESRKPSLAERVRKAEEASPPEKELTLQVAQELLRRPRLLNLEAKKRGIQPDQVGQFKANLEEIVKAETGRYVPTQALQREPVVRGRGGRPIDTAPLPIGKETPILEAGLAKAIGPKLEPREPYREAAERKGPLGGGDDEPPRPPHIPPAPGKTPEESLRIAQTFDDRMDKHVREADARTIQYENLTKTAQKIAPIAEKEDQAVYRAIERGEFDKLPAKVQEAYNKSLADINAERAATFKELMERKALTPDEMEEFGGGYQRRIRKTMRGEDEPMSTADPTIGHTPGSSTPSALKSLTFKEGVATDGSRAVVSDDGKGKYTVYENQKKVSEVDGPKEFRNGQTFELNGKEYKLERGHTDNIEKHAVDADGKPVEYYKSAWLSAVDAHQQVMSRKAFHDMMDDFKVNPAFDGVRTRNRSEALPGWRESSIPELKGVYLDPNMHAAIDNHLRPGLNIDVRGIETLRSFNRLATKSIFWNPVPHGLNATAHWFVARGADWVNPTAWKHMGKSMVEAWDAVLNRTPELESMVRAGAPMIDSGIARQNFRTNYGKMLGQSFERNPKQWEELTRTAGLGKGVDAVRLVYDTAQKVLWRWSDFLMYSRIRELEMGGMSRTAAIKDAAIHMPDYRTPIQMFGSTTFPKLMADNSVIMFGRYHMGMLKSLIHMSTDLLGPNATMDQRKKAFGNAMALGTLGLVVKPALDYLVQQVTGNEKAETRPRGPLAPLTNVYEAAEGKRSIGSALSNIVTITPGMKQALQTLSNQDFAGRKIVEPMAPLHKKIAQYAEYTAGNTISPYATFGPTVQPGTPKGSFLHELGSQLADVKVPTDRQIRNEQIGLKINRQSERQREKRPRGLIEYGAEQLTPKQGLDVFFK